MSVFMYKHRPTSKWVKINQYQIAPEVELYGYTTSLEFVDEQERASTYISQERLKDDLLVATYLKQENYGKKNFLEFELIEQKND